MKSALMCTCLLAALAAFLAVPAPASLGPARRNSRRLPVAGLPVAAALAVLLVGLLLGGARGLLWAVLLDALALTGGLLLGQGLHARRRRTARDEVSHATQVVAGQMRIGAIPGVALTSAARDCPSLERAAATQAIGGDVARALRTAGEGPGREGLLSLGRAWELCETTGAPIAGLASQVSDQVRSSRATEQVVAAELSGPRATARMLAVLPLVGIALGRMSGGDPVGFLTRSLVGQACLTGGVVLACAGVLWTEYMAHRAQEG